MKIDAKFEKFTDFGANFVWYRGSKKHTMWLPLRIIRPSQNTEQFTFYVNAKKEPDDNDLLKLEVSELRKANEDLLKRLKEVDAAASAAYYSLAQLR